MAFSRFGLSVVTIVFDDKTDIYWAKTTSFGAFATSSRTNTERIWHSPVLAPLLPDLEKFTNTVRPKKGYENKYNVWNYTIQDWLVRRQLLGVKGVAEVSSFGGLLKQYEIAVVPEN